MSTKYILPLAVVGSVVALVAWASATPDSIGRTPTTAATDADATIRALDDWFEARWADTRIDPPQPADELQILRRLSLSLVGSVPSLQEIREFEADGAPRRLDRWVERLLQDERFGTYFGERLARSIVGVETGPFLIYRRDRFVDWLAEQLQQDQPWSGIAREIMSGQGLWTGKPQTNFITVAIANDMLDRNKLAGRSVRAFLGQRIDCAQCHDHPFDDWKQTDFEGLAAFYSQATFNIAGIRDQNSFLFELSEPPVRKGRITAAGRAAFRREGHKLEAAVAVTEVIPREAWILADGPGPAAQKLQEEEEEKESDGLAGEKSLKPRFVLRATESGTFTVHDYQFEHAFEDLTTLEPRLVDPSVPFHPEWLPEEGTRRERLAAWTTHAENQRFGRAISNRVWGLLFGRPFHAPVDDLPDPGDTGTEVLDILASDFRSHDDSIKRLIRVIAASRVYQATSAAHVGSPGDLANLEAEWAVFPIVRLRPEQVIGSMLQASHVRTINQNSHLFVRTVRFLNEIDFVREYGDPGENELNMDSVTIPQALLLMNGNLTRERTKTDPFNAPGRILALSPSDEAVIENCFLTCLTRRPTAEERAWFLSQFEGATNGQRAAITQDLYWSLFNCDEFSWNH